MVKNEGMSHPDVGRTLRLISLRSKATHPNQKPVHVERHQMSAVGMTVNQHLSGLNMVRGKERSLVLLFSITAILLSA